MKFLNDYIFSPLVVLRTPVYSYDQYDCSGEIMYHLLKDPFFKAAVLLASNSLHGKLQSLDFDYDRMNPKIKAALGKYYNRMCFRSTPFGLFAGISTVRWGAGRGIILSDQLCPVVLFSYEQLLATANKFINSPLQLHLAYQANDSLYKVKDQYRYLRYTDEGESSKRTFYLNEIQITPLLVAVIDYCKTCPSKIEMVNFVADYCGADKENCLDYIEQLINLQVITCLSRIDASGSLNEIPRYDNLQGLYELLLAKNGDKESGLPHKSKFYVNLNKPVSSDEISVRYQEQLKKGLYGISRLLPVQAPEGLQNFITAFKKKFDRQVVPLLEALDPEIGIGYEKLAAIPTDSVLLKDVSFSPGQSAQKNLLDWSPVHGFLLEKLSRQGGMGQIDISPAELEQLPASNEAIYAPNSISVLFRLLGEQVYIESAGGATAVALSARFTLFDEAIEKNCRFIAEQTASANPGVVFADINHFCDSHTANIDRKKEIWEYEIPILTTRDVAADKQTLLTDLYVGVENEQVILWSERLGKRIIPVLSSAYNYMRNDLAVFRFLCDLQHQQLKTNLSFDLSHFFPALAYYPRVTYDGIIVHLATWHIKKESLPALKDLVKELQLPKFISVNEHDNQLVFDTSIEEDLHFLWEHIKNETEITIKEFPFAGVDSVVSKPDGRKYLPQLVASLYHTQEVYKGTSLALPAKDEQRKFMPGSDWLYCKLYCHPARSNEILTGPVATYINELEREDTVQKWFFVRYHDPAHHIRIRLHIEAGKIGDTVALLRDKFATLIELGIISIFQVDTYERELERYSGEMIEDMERWFCASSRVIMAYLNNTPEEAIDNLPGIAFNTIETICRAFNFSMDDRIALFKNLYNSLSQEFTISAIQNEQLKQKYRGIKNSLVLVYHLPDLFEQECITIHTKISRLCPQKKEQLFIDMVHMHLNRLFTDEPRKQEMIMYYCLGKHYQSVKARYGIALSSVYS